MFDLSKLMGSTLALVLSASVASAACVSGTSCPTTPPAPTPDASFTFSWGGIAQGDGMAVFDGEEGFALAEKEGGVSGDFSFTLNSDLCPSGCLEGGLTGTGRAWETVTASAAALGTTSGDVVSVHNLVSAAAAFQFSYDREINDPNFD